MMARGFMKGNEALAEAAIRAGARFFAGYPITPQSEVVEYMSHRMPAAGGRFVQSESELAAICMAYGAAAAGFRVMASSSGPGFSLKQEGISYITSAELPCVIVDVQRYGSGLGDIYQGQSDYFQAVKNGGHGDYRCMVLAPSSLQETVDLVQVAFDLAEKHKNPVIILTDASLGQMMEPVALPPMREHNPDAFEWSVKGKRGGPFRRVTSTMYYINDYPTYIKAKYDTIVAQEQRCECVQCDDAEIVLVAYGISSRVCHEAVLLGRKEGFKIGLLRPISLWPFPATTFEKLSPKAFLTLELSSLGQMPEDVALASRMRTPIHAMLPGDKLPFPEEVLAKAKEVAAGKSAPFFPASHRSAS